MTTQVACIYVCVWSYLRRAHSLIVACASAVFLFEPGRQRGGPDKTA
jgi:hypothetical protein